MSEERALPRGKYIEVPTEAILGRLASIGEKIVAKGGKLTEGVHGREVVVDLQPGDSQVVVRVYTSVARGADAVRGCGEDAVRFVIGYNRTKDGRTGFCALDSGGSRVYRTAPTKLSTEDRIKAFLDRFEVSLKGIWSDAKDWTICPDCGAPMQIRKNGQSGNQFWGCVRYPECRGTRRFEQ